MRKVCLTSIKGGKKTKPKTNKQKNPNNKKQNKTKPKASVTKISALRPVSEFSKWKSEAGARLGKTILALILPLTTLEGEVNYQNKDYRGGKHILVSSKFLPAGLGIKLTRVSLTEEKKIIARARRPQSETETQRSDQSRQVLRTFWRERQ